jgi:hypothetical protein
MPVSQIELIDALADPVQQTPFHEFSGAILGRSQFATTYVFRLKFLSDR